MASLKAEKPVGTSLFGQAKKEAAVKTSDAAPKGRTSKVVPKKAAPKVKAEPKKKTKAAKPAAKP